MKKIVAFGEIMLRLTPKDHAAILSSNDFLACYGGSESNVLVCLSNLGDKTEFLTGVPDNALGDAVIRHLNSYNVGTKDIIKKGDTLGSYFLEEGFGVRSSSVIYNRKHSEVSKLHEDDFNYDIIFEDCEIFHICGISFALSENTKELCFRLLKEAKKRNIKISFDFNYRKRLWTIEEAAKVFKEVAKYVDIMFCANCDLVDFLGTNEEDFYNKYNSEYLIIRERKVVTYDEHIATAKIYHKIGDKIDIAVSGEVPFSVLERIGAGDAFVGGVLHGLYNNYDIEKSLKFGMSCFVLKHTVSGDVFNLGEKAVTSLVNNMAQDVSR